MENRRAQARKVMIEKRKEDAERQAAALEQQEEQDRIMQERISAAAEEERRKQERCFACLLYPGYMFFPRLLPSGPLLCQTCVTCSCASFDCCPWRPTFIEPA